MSCKHASSGGVMRVKSVTLYSLSYIMGVVIVGVASLVVAAHQVSPALKPSRLLSDTSAIFSGQVVDRSRKSDRFPFEQPSQADIKVPAHITPNRKIKTCGISRCFASGGLYRNVS
jgi:hypothetical protein